MEWRKQWVRFRAWARTPPYLLLLLWCLAVQVTVIAFVLSRTFPDWTLVYTLGLASATAIAGTDVALWVQAYYSRLAQDRQFRGDLEVRFFENIYGPLYEDTRRAVLQLDDYSTTITLQNWPGIRATRFGAFLEPILFAHLDDLQGSLKSVVNAAREGRGAAGRIIRQLLDIHPTLSEPLPDVRRTITDTFVSDPHFVFDPKRGSPNEDILRGIRSTLDSVGVRAADLSLFASEVKERLEGDPQIVLFRNLRADVLEKAKIVHALVEKRMRTPFQETG